MNTKNMLYLYRMLLNATFLASLPDSEKHKLWEEARKNNSDHPMLPYFDYILEGPPGTRGIFENLHLEL
ncbi:MAG: hypothetical protein LBG26_01695 [Treponema sp.]|nr:hypothetical protein [Treponema sp.]